MLVPGFETVGSTTLHLSSLHTFGGSICFSFYWGHLYCIQIFPWLFAPINGVCFFLREGVECVQNQHATPRACIRWMWKVASWLQWSTKCGHSSLMRLHGAWKHDALRWFDRLPLRSNRWVWGIVRDPFQISRFLLIWPMSNVFSLHFSQKCSDSYWIYWLSFSV